MKDATDRAKLVRTISNLYAAQLADLKTSVNFPPQYQPGAAASTSEHATALVNWAESSGGCGLESLNEALTRILEPVPSPVNSLGWPRLLGVLIGIAAVGVSLYLWFWPWKPALFRLRVTVLSPERTPVDEARVWSSLGGEPKKVAGGWQFDIPAASCPRDGRVTVFAEVENQLLKGESPVQLDTDPNPTATIVMVKRAVFISGTVVDAKGNGVAGALVTAADAPGVKGALSVENGVFAVQVLPKTSTNKVRLHAEKDGYWEEEYFSPGQTDAKLILSRKR